MALNFLPITITPLLKSMHTPLCNCTSHAYKRSDRAMSTRISKPIKNVPENLTAADRFSGTNYRISIAYTLSIRSLIPSNPIAVIVWDKGNFIDPGKTTYK